jgi:putative cardiolipin synthase
MPEGGLALFGKLLRRGVKVRIVTNSLASTDNLQAYSGYAKSLVVDDRVAYIGTFNLDPRSANLNTGVGVVIHDAGIARQLRQAIERDMRPENSWRAGVDEPDSGGGLVKQVKLRFWQLLPLDPLL